MPSQAMSSPSKGRVSRQPLVPGKRAHLSVATESDLLIAIDAEAERRTKQQGYPARRSDIVVAALRSWLRNNSFRVVR